MPPEDVVVSVSLTDLKKWFEQLHTTHAPSHEEMKLRAQIDLLKEQLAEANQLRFNAGKGMA
jgi:hypothetical protein